MMKPGRNWTAPWRDGFGFEDGYEAVLIQGLSQCVVTHSGLLACVLAYESLAATS